MNQKLSVVPCQFDGCDRPRRGDHGWCRNHYDKWKRCGDPAGTRPLAIQGTPEERFWVKVDKRGPDECWEWLAGRNSDGYGTFAIRRPDRPDRFMPITAHRFSYILHGGDLPLVAEYGRNDRTIDHLCRNHLCVNPAHMEIVTHEENSARGSAWAGTSEQECLIAAAAQFMRTGKLTTMGFAWEMDVSKSAARRRLLKLADLGYVRQVVYGKSSYWELMAEAA